MLKTTQSINTKAKDIADFATRVLKSGGYYIGRYEAGDINATNSPRTDSSKDDNQIVSKEGVYPYNWITQSQASTLCQKMYDSSNFESDLMNSYAWDTSIVFIQEFSGDENYSTQKGVNTEGVIKKCGNSILSNVETGDEKQDVRCNIFDLAGNTLEWTTESYSRSASPYIYRGGCYLSSYDGGTSKRPLTYSSPPIAHISCRLVLYL